MSALRSIAAFGLTGAWRLANGLAVPRGHRILMYHSVGAPLPDDTYGLTIDLPAFKAQVRALKGVPTVAVRKAALAAQKEPAVAVTFDDGYADNLDAAAELVAAGIPFAVYVATAMLGKPHFLTNAQLQQLAAEPLCTIGSHSHTHCRLAHEPEDRQREELLHSKQLLEDLTGKPVTTLSYPHGSLSATTQRLAQELGYELATASRPGVNPPGALDWFHLRRTEVRVTAPDAFRATLDGATDYKDLVYQARTRLRRPSAQWVAP